MELATRLFASELELPEPELPPVTVTLAVLVGESVAKAPNPVSTGLPIDSYINHKQSIKRTDD